MRRSSPFIVDLVVLYRWYSIFLVSAIVMCCVMVLQSATVLQNHQDNATTSGQRLLCQSKYRYTCYDKKRSENETVYLHAKLSSPQN